ncbi:MAG: type II toxin-antitoxin system RelE/ParE family toxin [Patescibacteria group bacterium]
MISSYRDKDTAKLMSREPPRRLPPDIHRTAYRKLLMLDAATTLNDLKVPPGNHLEKLTKNRAGQHSIRINDQWRICFRWHQGNAHDVEITDYHK